VVRVLREEVVLETADGVLIGDVGDGGAHLEENTVCRTLGSRSSPASPRTSRGECPP
jgi:hypothetical protein